VLSESADQIAIDIVDALESAGFTITKTLLDGGASKIGGKLREEADELARALEAESEDRVASEAADVVYHLLVGLKLRGVALKKVIEVLAARAGG
jgi:phosphoribosyl-ATP pyrophosphohydrolase/phosphoribosyl-AMP cyclohydrolase